MDELTAWLSLAHVPGLHIGTLRSLLENAGSAAALVAAKPATLHEWGASDCVIRALQSDRTQILDQHRRWLDQPGRDFVFWGHSAYPPLLAELSDAPLALYVEGDASVLSHPQLAMVGARNPTPLGRENADAFAAHLASCGFVITSGLALGIDAASHRGALRAGGKTVAVCGTGLDIDYPREHKELRTSIAAQGALVSEFPLGTPPHKSNFPRRNRIISGLTLGTLVVEAAVQSGSLITARLAAEQGREVFAIPGSIHNPLARGCHRLIRQGAKLVETADDIFAELRAVAGVLLREPARQSAPAKDAPAPSALDKEYEILLDALGFEPASIDVLIARTGFKADAVASMLLILELENRIESCPGGLYVRRPD